MRAFTAKVNLSGYCALNVEYQQKTKGKRI